jgi:hypothetical protein
MKTLAAVFCTIAAVVCTIASVAAVDAAESGHDVSPYHFLDKLDQGASIISAGRTDEITVNSRGHGRRSRGLIGVPDRSRRGGFTTLKTTSNCCRFLQKLSFLDATCFGIIRKAEIDVIIKKKLACNGFGTTGVSIPALADKYEDVAARYNKLIDTVLAGGFADIDSDCLKITPSTFTFACEPGAAIINDFGASYGGADIPNFVEFYNVPDIPIAPVRPTAPVSPVAPPKAPVAPTAQPRAQSQTPSRRPSRAPSRTPSRAPSRKPTPAPK